MALAESLPYWRTSKSGPDAWTRKAAREIERAGGIVIAEGFAREADRSAYMMVFEVGADRFKVLWPVLESKANDTRAERVQAATMLFHDVKARAVTARVLGARTAFMAYLMLPDGRTAGQASDLELVGIFPKLLEA